MEQAALSEDDGPIESHELAEVLKAQGFPLNATLIEMLGEHYSHRTERRGCGFTQASRHLAVLVNRARDRSQDAVGQLFPWGHAKHEDLGLVLFALSAQLQREESRLLASIIADLVLPATELTGVQELPSFSGELKVGTCPLAEKYFLEVSDGFVRRKGRVNVLISEAGEPLLLEKLNLGDNHSCISVAEVVLNGVRLPPGCLFGVKREEGIEVMPNSKLPGSIIPVSRCTGFRFLRLTTLAVSPQNRRRAFTTHFQSQLDAGLYAPGEATIAQLRRVAEDQL
ncbi:MAG TPA: hypothetical protein VHB79_05270 [Polyangiaceae bacterium]|nr:hypothetical protein [Polyangiaceae bacterium]